MMFMIPSVYQNSPVNKEPSAGADFAPTAETVDAMMRYNEELAKAGVLISLDGLTPPVKGARVSFSDGRPHITRGPFTESTEIVGGYWILEVESMDEALRWAGKCPAGEGDVLEIRPVFETEDFPEDVREAAKSDILK
ncbi:YciI family protein [Spirochaeta dissipatitropha]